MVITGKFQSISRYMTLWFVQLLYLKIRCSLL